MLNKVCIMGNVGQDPEIRSFQNGDRVANFSVATTEKWTDKNTGEKKSITDWHKVCVFGGIVKVVESYVKKGTKLYIEGQLKNRQWDKPDGTKGYATEIRVQGFGGKLILLGSKDGAKASNNAVAETQAPAEVDDFDDEIPF